MKVRFIEDVKRLPTEGLVELRKIVGEIAPTAVNDAGSGKYQIKIDALETKSFEQIHEKVRALLGEKPAQQPQEKPAEERKQEPMEEAS